MSAALQRGVRLLVRAPDWLGDLVMSEPTLRALEQRVRELEGALTLAGTPRLLEVFGEQLRSVQRVDADDAAAWRNHDVALLFVNSFRAAWMATRARIPRRVGWARDLRGWLLSDAITPARERGGAPLGIGARGRWPRPLPRPFGATCVELAGALGVAVSDTRPRLRPSASAEQAVARRLESFGLAREQSFVLASVGARPGSAKGYPVASWVSIVREIASRSSFAIVLTCGPGEEEAVREVAESCSQAHAFVEPVADLCELVALCARAKLVLTADAGPRHVAVATRTPLVVAAGPTDPRHTADHTGLTTLLRVEVDCGPCHREVCPLVGERHHVCMRSIAPERVIAAALERLG